MCIRDSIYTEQILWAALLTSNTPTLLILPHRGWSPSQVRSFPCDCCLSKKDCRVLRKASPCLGSLATVARLSLSPQSILHSHQALHTCSNPPRWSKILVIRTHWVAGVSWYILNSSAFNKKLSQWHWHLIRCTAGSTYKVPESCRCVLTTGKKPNRLKNQQFFLDP